jgi:poly-gamma-glutamate synthesis protein (capsule biosynthesis protein)
MTDAPTTRTAGVTLFLCGDVMTGRGVDQILPHPSAPHLYESAARSARSYVEIAEAATGPIARPVDADYIWGDALSELERVQPRARIINLETAVTTSEDAWPDKGIHYRMHPANVGCLTEARIDCCVLANNHVLDWGAAGLVETLDTLQRAGMKTAGAGLDESEAAAPGVIDLPGEGRVLVFAFGCESAGVSREWEAGKGRAGVNFLADLSDRTAERIALRVRALKRQLDITVVSIHWGGNWGYHIPARHRAFAHALVDAAGVDLVHGHSSHHPMGFEVYRDKLILYGCGDFLNDYEGIGGYEDFRSDLTSMYFPTLDAATGNLSRLTLTPMQIRHFRVNRTGGADVRWLEATLNREAGKFGLALSRQADGSLLLKGSPV